MLLVLVKRCDRELAEVAVYCFEQAEKGRPSDMAAKLQKEAGDLLEALKSTAELVKKYASKHFVLRMALASKHAAEFEEAEKAIRNGMQASGADVPMSVPLRGLVRLVRFSWLTRQHVAAQQQRSHTSCHDWRPPRTVQTQIG